MWLPSEQRGKQVLVRRSPWREVGPLAAAREVGPANFMCSACIWIREMGLVSLSHEFRRARNEAKKTPHRFLQ
jgi:hypothetical protein